MKFADGFQNQVRILNFGVKVLRLVGVVDVFVEAVECKQHTEILHVLKVVLALEALIDAVSEEPERDVLNVSVV